MSSLDEAPVSSHHVRVKLLRLADLPERKVSSMEIVTKVNQHDRAVTTVRLPRDLNSLDWQLWYDQILQALRYLDGADSGIPFAGVTQEFDVTWDGVCRPI